MSKTITKEAYTQGVAHNALSQGTIIKGDIYAEGDFRVDGRVEGSIECASKIVVGPNGDVSGTITCENLEIMGMVDGTLQIKGNVSLKQTGQYTGEMLTNTLEIEPGAIFNGSCKMNRERSAKK
jgi:cytoskeletal protein CcmA (bactofilin family)